MQESFAISGFNSVLVRHKGDNMVLISRLDGMKVEETLQGVQKWLEGLFDSLDPWSHVAVTGYIHAWVRVHGIPLNLWKKSFLSKMVASVRELIVLHEDTESYATLEFAQVKIRTSQLGAINFFKKVIVNGPVYGLRINGKFRNSNHKFYYRRLAQMDNNRNLCFGPLENHTMCQSHNVER